MNVNGQSLHSTTGQVQLDEKIEVLLPSCDEKQLEKSA